MPIRVRPKSTRLLTVADLDRFPHSLPSGDVRYELDDGHLVVLALHDDAHSTQHSRIIAALGVYAVATKSGEGRGTVAIILRRNPDRVVVPDACFITNDQLPVKTSEEDYLETMPKLVVEVRGRHETADELKSKAAEYLAAGVECVWVLDDSQTAITAFVAGQAPRRFAAADLLKAPFLPGFAVPVADFFA